MAENMDFKVTVDASDAQRQLGDVSAKMRGVGTAAQTAGAGIGDMGRKTTAAAAGAALLVRGLGEITNAAGQSSPAFARLAGSITQTASAAVQMGTQFNPISLAIVAITGIVPQLIRLFGGLSDEMHSGSAEAHDFATELRSVKQAADDVARIQMLARGGGSAAERQAELQSARAQAEHIRGLIRAAREAPGVTAESVARIRNLEMAEETARRRLRAAQEHAPSRGEVLLGAEGSDIAEAQARIDAANAAAGVEERHPRGGRTGGGGARGIDKAAMVEAENRRQINSLMEEQRDIQSRILHDQGELVDMTDLLADAERSRADEFTRSAEKEIEAIRGQIDMRRQLAENEKERHEVDGRDVLAGIGIAEQAGAAVMEIARTSAGAKELMWGGFEAARAIGTAFIPGAQAEAVGHAMSSAMHFANAAKLGVGGGSAPSVGGGGGSGRTRPERDGAAGGGGSTYVINFNSPQDEATMGRMQRRAARAAERRYG